MKKICIYIVVLALVLSCSISAFAISPFSTNDYDVNKSISKGNFDYGYTISFGERTNFALWTFEPLSSYLGEYSGIAEDVAGTEFYLQNRPFGNTDFTQTSAKGDIIKNGFYMPLSLFPLNRITIRTQIRLSDSDDGVNAILPEDGASGEFAIGFVDQNGILLGLYKKTADYRASIVYGDLQYAINVNFDFDGIDLEAEGVVGYVIYTTAYDLYADWAASGSNTSNISIVNSNVINIYYNESDLNDSSESEIENNVDQIVNGTAPVKPPDGGGSVGDLEDIEGGIKDAASDGLSQGSNILEQFQTVLVNYTPAFLAVTNIFDEFINVPFFGVLVLISCALGILPIVLNIAMDVGKWSSSHSDRYNKRKGS